MELFAIHCTTCKARLIVRDESAIGDILSCPKCHSMVQVVAPSGWSPPSAASPPAAAIVAASDDPVSNAAAASPAKAHATPPPLSASAASLSGATPRSEVAMAAAPPALPPNVHKPAELSRPSESREPAESSATREPIGATAAKGSNWTILGAGIGSGVLLGAVAWLVVWVMSPADVPSLASATPAPASDSFTAAAPVGNAPQSAEVATSPAASAVAADPQASGNTAATQPAPAPTIAPPVETPPTAAPQPPAPATETPPTGELATGSANVAPATAIETPPSAIEAPKSELKLEPVAPLPVVPTEAAPTLDPHVAAGTTAGHPTDSHAAIEANANTDPEHSAAENSPAAVASSPGEAAPLPVAEIQRRLGVPLTRVDFSSVPLGHLAGFLSDVSGARVVVDEPSLAKTGKSRKTPVTVKLTGGTALAILEAAAEQVGLEYNIEPGRITLSARGP